MPRIFSLTVGSGIQIVGIYQQRVSYRGKVQAVAGTLALLTTLPYHVPHFLLFLIIGIPSSRPLTLAIPGIYLATHTGS